MRALFILVSFFAVIVSVFGLASLPQAESAGAQKQFFPIIGKDSTSTPTPTPTFTPTPVFTATPTRTPIPVAFRYRGYVQNRGWLDWQYEGNVAGTTDTGLQLEAFQMELLSAPPGVQLRYRANVANQGWLDWQSSGGTAGTIGLSRQVEAIQIGLDGAASDIHVSTDTYVAEWAWLGWVREYWIAGTTAQSRRMEAFRSYVRKGSPEQAAIKIAYMAMFRIKGSPAGIATASSWGRPASNAGLSPIARSSTTSRKACRSITVATFRTVIGRAGSPMAPIAAQQTRAKRSTPSNCA